MDSILLFGGESSIWRGRQLDDHIGSDPVMLRVRLPSALRAGGTVEGRLEDCDPVFFQR
ncbi:hypothetical protein SEA_A3WALLY_131 [Microbacterium phage A3Wally]|nr:hypothetical protein SEA_A3WALLY_131 [Microbacterium phage A3Wally]